MFSKTDEQEFKKRLGRFHKYYRATYTQAHILGFVSFTQPGIWSSLGNLGAGGLASTQTVNVANSLIYGIMIVMSPMYSILMNRIGIKPVLMIGTLGYVVYSAGLHENSKNGNQWLIMFGSVCCGISAAAFWTAEGTVAIFYPDEEQRGKFIATWQLWNKLGALITGGITLGLNIKNSHSGGISLNTYLVLIAIQCLGFPAAMLLSAPEKLIRRDGRTLQSNVVKSEPFIVSLKKVGKICMKKEVLCLAPLFFANEWFSTWQSNYVTHHFSVRARSLNSFLSSVIYAVADIVLGLALDLKVKKSKKVQYSWLAIAAFKVAFFIWSLYVQDQFDRNPESGIDWSGNPRFMKTFVPLQVFKMAGEFLFNWSFWVIGAYHFQPSEIPYISGLMRSVQSLGQCLPYMIAAVNSSDMVSIAVAAGIFFLTIPPVTYLVYIADDEEVKERFNDDEELEKLKGVAKDDTESVSGSIKKDKLEFNTEIKEI